MRTTRSFKAALAIVLSLSLAVCLFGCGASSSSTKTAAKNTSTSSTNNSFSPKSTNKQKKYDDPRWPTTRGEFLNLPDEQRWYNAWDSVYTECTIVGPVVDVYQATDEEGMPIFVSIGEEYPAQDSVTLVVWAKDLDGYEETLNAIDDGGAWISVTSYLGEYNGYLQFSSDNYVEWTYWTNVK